MLSLGIYLHTPFCATKCPYCDFYSTTAFGEDDLDSYTQALTKEIFRWGNTLAQPADTLYFGGGTPTLLGGKRLAALIQAVRTAFSLPDTAEITLEANPADELSAVFSAFAAAGGNRLSLGMQAADDTQLNILGRRHKTAQTEHTVAAAQAAGIHNLSLDLMLGIAGQTPAHIKTAVERCAAWGASHVSAYLLKLEDGTPYALSPPKDLPDEDQTVLLYHTACEALESHGFMQYEISNFAKMGFESRHNLKYWLSEPYLGLGPAAHSFVNGNRFYYPRSLPSFLRHEPPLAETPDTTQIPENSPEEFAMLRLRLTQGLAEQDFKARFGVDIPAVWRQRAAALPSSLIVSDPHGIRLTRNGFLVSDAVLSRLL